MESTETEKAKSLIAGILSTNGPGVDLEHCMSLAKQTASHLGWPEAKGVELAGWYLKLKGTAPIKGDDLLDFLNELKLRPVKNWSNDELKMGLSLGIVHRKRFPVATDANKTGRNEPCPCGSGKKYKLCCLDVVKKADIVRFQHGGHIHG